MVYGDSLSDNGNLFAATGQPGLPYYGGRFSNGPVAVEQMAASLQVPLIDYAWGGATTGLGNQTDGGTPTSLGSLGSYGMLTQFNNSQNALPSHLGSLFIVWGGPNDFLSPSPLDQTLTQIISRGVGDLLTIVGTLQSKGVKNIIVPGMPDLGLIPMFNSGHGPVTSAEATFLAEQWNAALVAQLTSGVQYVDTFSLFDSVAGNPSRYGFTNVTDPCFNGASLCANPSQYLFWDDVHPTTQADALIAQDFIQATVPEPGAIVLAALGLAILIAMRRASTRKPLQA